MNGPLLPGEPQPSAAVRSLPFLCHQLGQLEQEYRRTAAVILARIPSGDDLAIELRRVLSALDG